MVSVALWFEDSDQVIEERVKRQLIRSDYTSDFMYIDNKSFKFVLKNSQIFIFLILLKISSNQRSFFIWLRKY